MICNNCHNEFSGNFCPKCGAKAEPEEQAFVNNPYDEVYKNIYEEKSNNYFVDEPKAKTQDIPEYQPQYNNYQPQVPKKSKKISVVSIVAIVLSIIAIVFCSVFGSCYCTYGFFDTLDRISGEASTTVNNVGDNVNSGSFTITCTEAKTSTTYDDLKAKDGYEYLTASFNITNNSEYSEYWDGEYSCYADDVYCQIANDIDVEDYEYEKLLGGKSLRFDLVFEVPKDAESITVMISRCGDDLFESEQIYNFTVK
jgi:hypothetical protein